MRPLHNMTPTRNRKNNRLHKFDYSSSGFYFITICTKNRLPYFGTIHDGQPQHNLLGAIACQYLKEIPHHFKEARVDESIIMPNHVHAIIRLSNVGDAYMRPLSIIVQNYKASVTRKIRGDTTHSEFSWQRSYYDHVIRNEKSYLNIQNYIRTNPIHWDSDSENRVAKT